MIDIPPQYIAVAQTTEAVLVETFEEGLPIFEFVEAVEDDDPDGGAFALLPSTHLCVVDRVRLKIV